MFSTAEIEIVGVVPDVAAVAAMYCNPASALLTSVSKPVKEILVKLDNVFAPDVYPYEAVMPDVTESFSFATFVEPVREIVIKYVEPALSPDTDAPLMVVVSL